MTPFCRFSISPGSRVFSFDENTTRIETDFFPSGTGAPFVYRYNIRPAHSDPERWRRLWSRDHLRNSACPRAPTVRKEHRDSAAVPRIHCADCSASISMSASRSKKEADPFMSKAVMAEGCTSDTSPQCFPFISILRDLPGWAYGGMPSVAGINSKFTINSFARSAVTISLAS